MMSTEVYHYQGQELDIFAHARRWKIYWARYISKWIHGDILEVGAGLGTNTALLQSQSVRSWHCLEPDPELETQLATAIANIPVCSASRGTIRSMASRRFDSILYIDVLEHIERDSDELSIAASLLRPGGHIVVLSPAYQFLFSEFDKSIGHCRRYDGNSLRRCSPHSCKLEKISYLDSVGIFLSLANRVLLRQSTPTLQQIRTWDKYIVPISRVLDPALGHSIGKTVVGIWTRL
jgi:2-polyprenyl-3-methyl-5-hydroxy-6-metoxy-1,4-benzoquinol methylase